MKRKHVTTTLIAVIVALVGWDIYLAADEKEDNTISKMIQDISHDHPMIAFGLGVLIGHWLWDNEEDNNI